MLTQLDTGEITQSPFGRSYQRNIKNNSLFKLVAPKNDQRLKSSAGESQDILPNGGGIRLVTILIHGAR
jgi:hypothetical protein